MQTRRCEACSKRRPDDVLRRVERNAEEFGGSRRLDLARRRRLGSGSRSLASRILARLAPLWLLSSGGARGVAVGLLAHHVDTNEKQLAQEESEQLVEVRRHLNWRGSFGAV